MSEEEGESSSPSAYVDLELEAFRQKVMSKTSVSFSCRKLSSFASELIILQVYKRATQQDKDKQRSMISALETELGKEKFHELLQAGKEEVTQIAATND